MEWEENAKNADIVFSMKLPDSLPRNSEIIAIAGIARSQRFFEGLERSYSIVKKIDCPDHFNIHKKTEQALKLGLPVVITEKNAVRLPQQLLENKNLFISTISLQMR